MPDRIRRLCTKYTRHLAIIIALSFVCAPFVGIITYSPSQYSVVVSSPSEPSSARARTLPYWTIMVYMAGDNSLSNEALDDLNEMEAAGSTAEVNIIVLIDQDKSGDTRLYRVTKDPDGYRPVQSTTNPDAAYDLSPPVSETLADNGAVIPLAPPNLGLEANLGDISTLLAFVNWTAANYPAERYMLDIWDHGDGWQGGFCWDETDGTSHLTLPDLVYALPMMRSALGKTIDLLGFDACTMAQCEIAHSVKPYVDIFVGSEALEPGDGWCYNLSFGYLVSKPDTLPELLGKRLVEDFCTYFDVIYPRECDGYYEDYYSLSAWNLTLLDDAFDELNNVSQKLKQNMTRLKPMFDVVLFNVSRFPMEASSNLDVGDLSKRLARAPDMTLASASDKLYKALISSRIAEGHGRAAKFQNATGLTINFPERIPDSYRSLSMANETSWDEMLSSYNLSASVPNVEPEIAIASPSEGANIVEEAAVYGTSSADATSVQIKLDKSAWTPISALGGVQSLMAVTPTWQVNIDVRNLSVGEHRLCARAYDGLDYSAICARKIFVSLSGITLVPTSSGAGGGAFARLDPSSFATVRLRLSNHWSQGEFRIVAESLPQAWSALFKVVQSTTPSNVGMTGSELAMPLTYGGSAIVDAQVHVPPAENGIYEIIFAVIGSGETGLGIKCRLAMLANVYERRPDLAIVSVEYPQSLVESRSANVKALVANLGEDESPATELVFYENPGAVEFARLNISAIPVGSIVEKTCTWRPSYLASNLTVVVDPNAKAREYNLTNNLYDTGVDVLHYNATILHTEGRTTYGIVELRPDQNASVELEIINDGDFADNYTISTNASTLPKPWSITLSSSVAGLLVGASMSFFVNITPPRKALYGTVVEVNVTARSQMTKREATFALSARIVPYFSIDLRFKDNSAMLLKPSETREVGLIVNNSGNLIDNYTVEVFCGDPSWSAKVNATEISLEAEAHTELTLSVKCPENAPAGATCKFVVTVTSRGAPSNASDFLELIGVVDEVRLITIVPSLPNELSWNGTTEGILHLRNAGNTNETIELAIEHDCYGLWIETNVPDKRNLTYGSTVDVGLRFVANRAVAGEYNMRVMLTGIGSSVVVPLRIETHHDSTVTCIALEGEKVTQGASKPYRLRLSNEGNCVEKLELEYDAPMGMRITLVADRSRESCSEDPDTSRGGLGSSGISGVPGANIVVEPFSEAQVDVMLSPGFLSVGKHTITLRFVNSTGAVIASTTMQCEILPNYYVWLGLAMCIFSAILFVVYFVGKRRAKASRDVSKNSAKA